MASANLAKDIYLKTFKTVTENDTLSRCLDAFETGMPPVLAVYIYSLFIVFINSLYLFMKTLSIIAQSRHNRITRLDRSPGRVSGHTS